MVKFSSLAALSSQIIQSLRHPSRRNILYVLAIVWINAINISLFYHRNDALNYITNSLNEVVPLNNFKGHAIPKKLVDDVSIKLYVKHAGLMPDKRRVEGHSSNYDDFFRKHKVGSVLQLSFTDRCDAYFKNLYSKSFSWSMDATDDFAINMEYQNSWGDYERNHKDEKRKKIASEKNIKPEDVHKDDLHKALADEFDGLKEKAKTDEFAMRDYLANLRIFNKCYITRDDHQEHLSLEKFANSQARFMKDFPYAKYEDTLGANINANTFESCRDLESKVFPWLSFVYPVYERFSGDMMRLPPVMSKYIHDAKVLASTNPDVSHGKDANLPIHSTLTNNKPCFLNEFKNKLNGKGLVIPVTTGNLEDARNLITLLRALNNRYPIQIVYYRDLKENHKKKLIDAAQLHFSDLPESFKKVADRMPKDFFDRKHSLATQEIWFIDAESIVHDLFTDRIAKVPLSIMATFANSFEEFILMDPKTVPLQNPSYFFDLKKYKKSGAFFYRSRPTKLRDRRDALFFNRVAPSLIDTVVFDIPMLSSKMLDIPFFSNLHSVQDAGVAVINKARHFGTMAALVQLGLYWPANYRGNAGSEIWLAFAVTGNDKFEFNKYMPAAVGTEVPQSDRLLPNGSKKDSHELCSSQAGHVDGESGDKLAWMSNGFAVCSAPTIDYSKEFITAYKWRHFPSPEALKHFYTTLLEIVEGIIPPFDGVSSLLIENTEQEPTSPWAIRESCESQTWCAYSRVGGKSLKGERKLVGQRIKFKQEDVDMYRFYGDIWNANE